MNKSRLRFCLLAVLIALPVATPVAANRSSLVTLYDPLIDSATTAVYDETAGKLSTYIVNAMFIPAGDEPASISGSIDLEYVNQAFEPLPELYFHLYPNGKEYGLGGMTIDAVTVDGAAVQPAYLDSLGTTSQLPLAQPLPSGAETVVQIDFTATIPTNPARSYGMFKHEDIKDTYTLAHWMPLLAGRDENGWNLESTETLGDPVFTNTALFDVTLTYPSEFTFATTGSEVSRADQAGISTSRFLSAPVRDFVMAASPHWRSDKATAGETTIQSYFYEEDSSGGLEALVVADKSMELFNQLFGAFPYDEFDIVQVDLSIAAGIEFPGIIFIAEDFYNAFQRDRSFSLGFESLIAHEVAHQWWYGLVGNNQYQHAFLDEGLANLSATFYYEFLVDPAAGKEQRDITLELPYLATLYGFTGDVIVDQPTSAFPSMISYDVGVYSKGGLGFQAMREEIGDTAFFTALQTYTAEYRFEVATPDALLAAFEIASGQDLSEFWRHWFEAAEGEADYSPADLDRLLEIYQ